MASELKGHISAPAEIRVELVSNGPQGPAGPPGDTPYVGENGDWWVGDTDTGVPAQGGPPPDHSKLPGRDAPDQHTIEAITDLREALDMIPDAMTADDLRKILMNGGARHA